MKINVECDLYEPWGKYYGTCYFQADYENLRNRVFMLEECGKSYGNPSEFIIRVSWEGHSYLLLPAK